jgi:hypothetical protein
MPASLSQDILNIEFQNKVLAHAAKRALMIALHNPAVAKYPIPEVVRAINRTMKKMPIQLRNQPLTANP